MKKLFIAILFPALIFSEIPAQNDSIPVAKYFSTMIPMRDGVKLYTVIRVPLDTILKVPILVFRTPYGVGIPSFASKDSILRIKLPPGVKQAPLVISVQQDSRGRHNSEGVRKMHPPIIHHEQKDSIDESTDTWDTIDWLINNVAGNNGNAGLTGASYPGWLSLVGTIDPHPSLKAAIETACMADLWMGDDFHHNGAFRLEYSFSYSYAMEKDRWYQYPDEDQYDFFMKLGALKNVNKNYFNDSIKTWNDFVNHPDYDSFWQKNSPLNYMHYPQVPIMHRGGYYDQEDINGPQLMYSHLEKKDTFNRNFLVLGPWNHGGIKAREDSTGKIAFPWPSPSDTTDQRLQGMWWQYWLWGNKAGKFNEATCYQTGSDKWQTFSEWPPKNATVKKLYLAPGNKNSFLRPKKKKGFQKFISDPANPVPYRKQPIKTIDAGWSGWHTEDQRFISSRPDVVSFFMDSLTEDLTVTGKIIAHLFASTSATDADWVVKLIDVYPDYYQNNPKMSGYQLPVAMEVFRGRYRKSFSNPSPLTPNKPEEFVIDLHDINHVFRKGHKLMIQVQSTWFPVIDRNPQKYVPNIFLADESDFIKAEHRIYFSRKYPTYIELPVMKE
jgi:uncharacterized protein